ncbi:MAG: hypothetical protein JSU98_02660 [Gemmatimonadales bacterium]|jgi:hypothetical protein|nr:MAG: hypothetical protein JSU98_02660 [Gemmatimonadales bacterium]
MFLLHTHSGLRYVVFLLGIAVVWYALRGVIAKAAYDDRMRILGGLFAVLIHLNIVVGLAIIVFSQSFEPYLGVHIVTMVFAAAVAHIVPAVMKRRPMEDRTYLPHAVAGVIALALVVAGILVLPAGRIIGS